MKLTLSVIFMAAFTGLSSVNAAGKLPSAYHLLACANRMSNLGFTNCADLATAISNTPQGQNRANVCSLSLSLLAQAHFVFSQDYCRIYMGLTPVTATSTSTSIRGTRTVETATYSTTLIQVTPETFTRQVAQRLTTSVTVTPATRYALFFFLLCQADSYLRTSTATITSTAYIANDGTTIAIAKRSLEARARMPQLPAFFSGFNGREMKAACRCVNAPRPT